ncbi:MAG: von Willebrand factor type A [candidate division TM6 bacterium GW2011_GWF2_38_10]|nr:MAG: von Willebrand factor type A [candidate division TM6 bacterium GW2011_GWF2_38_10]
MNDIFGIHWASFDNCVYIPLFIAFFVLAIKQFLRIKKSYQVLVHPDNASKIFKHFSLTRFFFRTVFLCSALVFIFIALLQPQWGKRDEQVIQEGRDLLIVLDVSRSMLAQDFSPNRLAFAKLKIRTLLETLSCVRVGLIAFSGSAFVQCPLTVDHAAFLMFLEYLDVESISSGTTAIDRALSSAIKLFAQYEGRKNKNVILLTDGEDFSMDLEVVKKEASEHNIRVFALGIGSVQGAPIPEFDERGRPSGHVKDSDGNVVVSRLNESLLQSMCKDLEGAYFSAGYKDDDVQQIARLVQKMEKEKITDKKISLFEDHYPWFLGVAWVLLLLEWII